MCAASLIQLTRKAENKDGQFTADDTDVTAMTSILICDRLEAKRIVNNHPEESLLSHEKKKATNETNEAIKRIAWLMMTMKTMKKKTVVVGVHHQLL